MGITTLIYIIGAAWIVQYALTFVQIRHYRAMMGKLLNDYKQKEDYFLFSGISRKPFSAGGIAAIVVDKDFIIQKCYVLSGYTVLSRFKPYEKYDGKHVGEMLADANERLKGSKESFSDKKSLARAFMMAAENAVHSIANKRMAFSKPSETQII